LSDEQNEPRVVRWLVADAIANPRRTVAGWVLLALIALLGVSALKVEIATESVLDQSGTEWQRYLTSGDVFGSDEDIVVALAGNHYFDQDALDTVRDLAGRLAQIPGVRRVDSVATTPIVRPSADGEIDFSPPFAIPPPPDEMDARASQTLRSEVTRGLLVSEDGKTFALRLRLDDPLHLDVQRLALDIDRAIGDRAVWVSGVPIFRAETGQFTRREVRRFVPITVLIIALLLAAFFRSAKAVSLALAIGGIGATVVLGSMGALGVSLSLTAAILPSILIAIGCANATHLLAEVDQEARDDRLAAGVLEVARPITMASAVTALAFLSGALVPIEAVRVIAAFGALGALVLALATIHLGSAVLQLKTIARTDHRSSPAFSRLSRSLAHLATTRPRLVVASWVAVLMFVGAGVTGVSLETDVTKWFPRDGEVRRSYEAISERLAGISPLNVVVEANGQRTVTEPEMLRAIDELTRYLEDLPDVGRALSITSLVKDIHRGLNPGPADPLPLPSNAGLIEQYLLLLESSDEVREFVSDDRKLASISVRSNNNGSERLLAISAEAERWWSRNGPRDSSARTTGIMFEFARAEREITTGQLSGLGLDCLALAALYVLIFRSIRLTLTALVPTVATVLSTFGVLGWAGAALDAGTVFVGTLAIGVTVDETVHLVSAYARTTQRGESSEKAIEGSLLRILPALVMTTVTLAGGFLVLGVSSFSFTRQLGLATGIAMAVCALANATLLPSLLALRSNPGRGADREPWA
jgi:predicted RND superfamily exporter protein